MQEEYSSRLGPIRRLREPEIELVRQLLLKVENAGKLLSQIDSMDVQEMSDGGMGSLYFVSATKDPRQRHFGERVAEMQFNDTDGVPILASLNIDRDGDLFELDVWKVDFSPVVQLNPNKPG